MKQSELSRELKRQMWHQFDAGATIETLSASLKLPAEAVTKQHRLWSDFRARNPKRK